MKHVNLIIAKIRPEIYQLIESGEKTWEVRDDSFTTEDDTLAPSPTVIQYVDLHGKALGLWQVDPNEITEFCKIGKDGKLNSGAKRMLAYSSVDETTFRYLFNLEHTLVLHRVRLVLKLNSLTDLTDEEESMTQEYTPTDNDVKADYVRAFCSARNTKNWSENSVKGERAFNRWLAAHDAQIRAEASSEALELVTSRELDVGVNAAYKDDLLTPASSALQKAMRAIAQYRKEQQ